jgi:hypothetical protein
MAGAPLLDQGVKESGVVKKRKLILQATVDRIDKFIHLDFGTLGVRLIDT